LLGFWSSIIAVQFRAGFGPDQSPPAEKLDCCNSGHYEAEFHGDAAIELDHERNFQPTSDLRENLRRSRVSVNEKPGLGLNPDYNLRGGDAPPGLFN
jgi:hypothetical protein